MVIPAGYYMRSDRVDGYDERFTWRMFSDVRMVRCRADFVVDDQPLKLSTKFHTAWGSLLQRARPQVVEGVTARLCERSADTEVRLKLSCREPDRSIVVVSAGDVDLCVDR